MSMNIEIKLFSDLTNAPTKKKPKKSLLGWKAKLILIALPTIISIATSTLFVMTLLGLLI